MQGWKISQHEQQKYDTCMCCVLSTWWHSLRNQKKELNMINKYVFNMGRKYMCRRNKSTYLEFKLRSATLPNPTYSQTSRWAPILPSVPLKLGSFWGSGCKSWRRQEVQLSSSSNLPDYLFLLITPINVVADIFSGLIA